MDTRIGEGGACWMPRQRQRLLDIAHCKAQLARLFEGLLLVMDSEGTIEYVQSGLAAAIDLPPEDIAGMNIGDLLSPPGPSSFQKLLDAAVESDAPVLYIKDSGGGVHESKYTIVQMEYGDEQKYVVSFHDLYGDSKLSLLQRFAGAFLKDVNLGVLLINTSFELVEISDMACKVLGVRREEALGKSMDVLFAGVPIEHRFVQPQLLDGMVVKNHAFSWTNDRERYELIMDTSLLKDARGRVVGAYVMFKDVSNLRSLEQQVQRSDRLAMIGQIAAGTAHEIRNPLTSIKGFLQVLKKSLKERGMDKEYGYTELMLSEIDRINDLVSEFLLLSKPKLTKPAKIDVSTVINEIFPIIRNEAILYDVTVEYRPAPGLPPVMADRELLKQVFINLCKNGIEAMSGEGGKLIISERNDDEEGRINVLVQDTGPGIPSFLIDKIFDPFFTTKEEGTGLGLSVCQRIVHDIGGTLRVSSKGYGTTFIVSIPYASA